MPFDGIAQLSLETAQCGLDLYDADNDTMVHQHLLD